MTSGGIKGLETPVVEDEQLHAAERPLDAGIATIAVAQAGVQPPVASVAGLLVEQQSEPFRMGERRGFTGCFDLAEGLGHAGNRPRGSGAS